MASEQTAASPGSDIRGRIAGLIRRKDSTKSKVAERAMTTYWWEWASYALILLPALVLRLWDLGSRAVHHDESLHSFYSWELYAGKGFAHNPMMHGPFQFEANAAIFYVFGDSDYTSRLLYAVVGTVLVFLPFFLRGRLGRLGAILVATMLAFSPAMLYFSRFARNDILMAAWVFGLVIVMWRYLDEGKSRYLYIASALLAVAFATKETAYMISAALGLFLALMLLPAIIAEIKRRANVDGSQNQPFNELDLFSDTIPENDLRDYRQNGLSPPVAIGHIITGAWSSVQSGIDLSRIPRPAAFLLFLITITLPQWSALTSVLQHLPIISGSNLVLANPDGVFPIGAPSGGGIIIAVLVVLAALVLSIYIGFQWNWSVWWRAAIVFYAVWATLYTTFFTNIEGIGSGVWQGLGYWIAQQEVARGNQPWYYYLVITPTYEFLPLLFSAIAGFYYARKRDLFGLFLVFWASITFVLFTIASEKMPWLLVNITLPLIVLAGRFMGDVIEKIEWKRICSGYGYFLLIGVPILLVALWQIAFWGVGEDANTNVLFLGGMVALAAAVIAVGAYVMSRTGARNFASFAIIPVTLILLGLGIRAGYIASFKHGDVPVEMLVYTQTSPDITRLIREIEKSSAASGQSSVPITIDQTSGFTWPWAWYLRNNTRVSFLASNDDTPLEEDPNSSVVLIHSQNQAKVNEVLAGVYSDAELVKHRWWFPEDTYRGLTLGKFIRSFGDRDSWKTAMDYFLFRNGVRERLGSENGYVYFAEGFPDGYEPSE